MGYKFIAFTFSLILLTYTLAAQETGTLYLKKVNGKIGWFKNGDEKKHLKYTGEIFEGKPNGTGELNSPSRGKYSGEYKNGLMHGQVTHTYVNGKKRIGEFRKGKPWNVKSFDKKISFGKNPIHHFFIERYLEAYKTQFDDFLKSIIKKTKPNVSFEDGKKALIIANSATESVKYNKLVKLKN